jgi:hypothetical protein
LGRLDAGAAHGLADDASSEIDGGKRGKSALKFPHGGANGRDDHRFVHR